MTYQVRLIKDPYADGWIAGYQQALTDVAAEQQAMADLKQALLERLRYQHQQAGTGGVIR